MYTSRSKVVISLVAVNILAGCSSLFADTVGYWRFENDYLDSSGNGYHLSVGGDDKTVTLGQGTPNFGIDFWNPIPKTGAANTEMFYSANFTTSYGMTTSSVSVPTSGTMTVETLFNLRTPDYGAGSDVWMVSQWAGSSTIWGLVAEVGGSETFRFIYKNSSFGSIIVDSGIAWVEDKDFYVAASVDLGDSVKTNNSVTFYIQNLTDNTALQTVTVTQSVDLVALDQIAAATADVIAVGAQSNGRGADNYLGYYDEVRISNTALTQAELLVSVPEPMSSAVIVSLCAVSIAFLRRRR